jgi:hypothetical protein
MGFDKIWLRPTLDAHTWVECGPDQEFGKEYERLTHLGNFVVLSHGKSWLIDEIFLFHKAADAKQFFADAHGGRQSVDGEGKPVGFDCVSLYLGGKLIDQIWGG